MKIFHKTLTKFRKSLHLPDIYVSHSFMWLDSWYTLLLLVYLFGDKVKNERTNEESDID